MVNSTVTTVSMGCGTSLLTSLDSDKLRIKTSAVSILYCTYSQKPGDVLIECVTLGEYGYGKTFEEAMQDLKSSIVDYYFMLKRHSTAIEKEWSPAPVGSISHEWQMIRTYLEET
jgi:hypothetical protein